jgi:integrase
MRSRQGCHLAWYRPDGRLLAHPVLIADGWRQCEHSRLEGAIGLPGREYASRRSGVSWLRRRTVRHHFPINRSRRWSELAGLQWQEIDWLGGELLLRRVIKQISGEVKTIHSAKPLSLDAPFAGCVEVAQTAKRVHRLDVRFADQCGILPRSYACFYEKLGRSCQGAGITHVSAHSFRLSYRAWLDERGTP